MHANQRERLRRETHRDLGDNYYRCRKQHLRQHPGLSGVELIVATTVDDFYEKVIVRFSSGGYPSLAQFVALFYEQVKIIAKKRTWDNSDQNIGSTTPRAAAA